MLSDKMVVDENERESSDLVREMLSYFYHRPEDRALVLNVLIEAIEQAHQRQLQIHKSWRWSITLRTDSRRIRLNVGQTDAVVLSKNEVYYVAHGPLLTTQNRNILRPFVSAIDPYNNDNKQQVKVVVSIDKLEQLRSSRNIYDLLRVAHFEAIRLQANYCTNWHYAHSQGVLKYLRSLPDFINTPNPYKIWPLWTRKDFANLDTHMAHKNNFGKHSVSLDSWTVQHDGEMQVGDAVVICQSNHKAAIHALGKIDSISEAYQQNFSVDEDSYPWEMRGRQIAFRYTKILKKPLSLEILKEALDPSDWQSVIEHEQNYSGLTIRAWDVLHNCIYTNSSLTDMEGRKRLRQHYFRERKPSLARRKKILALETLGVLQCEACGFVFQEQYGLMGETYIECHHTIPLSSTEFERPTKLEELALVCANCHRMLHYKRKEPLTIAELRMHVRNPFD